MRETFMVVWHEYNNNKRRVGFTVVRSMNRNDRGDREQSKPVRL